ncbi:putative protein N(5)-glutamine methyltransferase [Frondihabitans cladoniiphilus]|uniref:peptide chain release factor N(5)-glutamine methyltransferase n=1 Tax=Frondihabitans cladoniiphilus TaxID=715785 RepID=A0ABP8W1P1_9MICO
MPTDPRELVARLRAAGCVYAEDEARLLIEAAADDDDLARMLGLRVDGEPLEHVLGWAEFDGLRIRVGAGVFVPRRRTVFLVETAWAGIPRFSPDRALRVLDLCCGSGAAGAALEARAEAAGVLVEVHAADLEPAAVAMARTNLSHPERVTEGDLFEAVPRDYLGRFDVILANAPYVPTDELAFMPVEARDHEPRSALDGGPGGTALHERIARDAPAWLAPDGRLLIETSVRQAATTRAFVAASGLDARILHSDEFDATLVEGAATRFEGAARVGGVG